MGVVNRQLTLAHRPDGLVRPEDFALVEAPVPEPAEGEAVVRTEYLSIDPTVRTWISEARSYFPPVAIGEPVRCPGAGRVVASAVDAFAVGDPVYTLTGWQDYAVVRDDGFATRLPDDMALTAALGVLGNNGITAYVGMLDIGRPQEGETVVVSAAAGATGSVAGQLAKRAGARVVGIAGRPDKCAWVVDELGFDACVDHRAPDFVERLRAATPQRVDVYFDNVGGPVLDAVLKRLAGHARVVLCGAIAVYNAEHKPPGPANYLELITQRATMTGFNTFDHWDRFGEITDQLAGWLADGSLRSREHVLDGLERAPEALNMLFTGDNLGKLLVRVADDQSRPVA
ncbi:MAG: NADP-dependent oxidoreductase [Acidimicrobiales bacterium]|nr:NADP-dependent oxidoreductase [Acidimicrobiales bacterium]MCB9371614.1 NADP-dependent oxidoreductase [Microthrixaceae bacterium]